MHRQLEHHWSRCKAIKVKLISESHRNSKEKLYSKNELIKAITVLSYRISGIGLYPEFINAIPDIIEYESPFLVQNREIVEFIEKYKLENTKNKIYEKQGRIVSNKKLLTSNRIVIKTNRNKYGQK